MTWPRLAPTDRLGPMGERPSTNLEKGDSCCSQIAGDKRKVRKHAGYRAPGAKGLAVAHSGRQAMLPAPQPHRNGQASLPRAVSNFTETPEKA